MPAHLEKKGGVQTTGTVRHLRHFFRRSQTDVSGRQVCPLMHYKHKWQGTCVGGCILCRNDSF